MEKRTNENVEKIRMQVEKHDKWNAKIGFIVPEEKQRGAEYHYTAYAEGKTPKELRKAIREKIKYLENNGRVVKTIELVHDVSLALIFSKEEYLSGKAKGKRE